MDREQQRAAALRHAEFIAKPVKAPLQVWGGHIFIRRLSIESALKARGDTADNSPASIAKNLALRICDEDGTPTFDAANVDDIAMLVAQGVEFLIELNKAVAEVDSPGKPSTPSESS